MPDAPLCASCRRRPAEPAWRPFCSERCRTIDLGRWLTGRYRVPGEPAGETDEEPKTSGVVSRGTEQKRNPRS
jgi:uncharacterized protein